MQHALPRHLCITAFIQAAAYDIVKELGEKSPNPDLFRLKYEILEKQQYKELDALLVFMKTVLVDDPSLRDMLKIRSSKGTKFPSFSSRLSEDIDMEKVRATCRDGCCQLLMTGRLPVI